MESNSIVQGRQRILLMLPSLHAGGAENYALRLIKFAGTASYDWHVISPQAGIGDLHHAFSTEGVTVQCMSVGYVNPLKTILFYRYLKKNKFDAICTFTGVFGGLVMTVAASAGVSKRIAWHRRSTPAYKPTVPRRIYAAISLWMMQRYSTRILSNSKAALDFFHGLNWPNDDQFRVVPNGVDKSQFTECREAKEQARTMLGLSVAERIVGHVGRYDPAKNHETIFRVAAKVTKYAPSVRFVFCGKDTDSARFRKRLDHYGIADYCICLGLQQDMPRVYRCFDVFYFPSVTEGQPNALIEAQLAKLPFVASDIPGIRDSVPPKLRSQLLPPKSVQDAAEAIMVRLRGAENETGETFEWASLQFDLEKNMTMALREFAIAPSGVSHA